MKLIEIEDLLIKNCINLRNSFVTADFVRANLNLCRSVSKDVLYEECIKFFPIRFKSKINVFIIIMYVLSFSLFYFLGLQVFHCHLISNLVVLNFIFVLDGRLKNFICRLLVREVFKVKVDCCRLKGFNFIVIGSSEDSTVVHVRTINKKPSGDDRRVYLIHKDFLYVALFDYLNGSKNCLDLNKLNHRVYSALTMEVDTLNYLVSS